MSIYHKETFLIQRLIKVKTGHESHQFLGIFYSRGREIFQEKLRSVESEGNFGIQVEAENMVDE